jgi:hypothetical protein
MKTETIQHDERTVIVENASYRWGYLVLSFGLLVDVAYRGFVRQESTWDLLGIVMLGGLVSSLYQGTQRIWGRRWWLAGLVIAVAAAAVAAVLVLLR